MSEKNKFLVLGDGLLGSEIVKQTNWDYISRKKDNFDLNQMIDFVVESDYNQIINCIGHVNTYSPRRKHHWEVNYEFVANLVDGLNSFQKITHISSDYVYCNSISDADELDVPVHARNWYSYTKLLSDGYVQLKSDNYLLIRTSFKEKPFMHPRGWMIKGNFDYVDVISEKIIKLVKSKASGVYNLGTEKKTLFALGKQTNKDIEPTTDYIDETVPDDVSMNLGKLERKIC